VERFRIEVLDVVQWLRREFEGDRENEVLEVRQRDFLIGDAVEVAQLHYAVDYKDRRGAMVVRLLGRAGSDGDGDDAD
jgi:hypothetical protein